MSEPPPKPVSVPVPSDTVAESGLNRISTLLSHLDEVRGTGAIDSAKESIATEDRLAAGRLGVASGLFSSLRAKHSPTASHSLRVAIGLSNWAQVIGLEDPHLLTLETAALMHDIGKIGVPDAILTKPSKLSPDETALLDRYRLHGLDILASCCLSAEIVDIVRFAGSWYDGSRGDAERNRDKLPVGSRMLSIVDAYDSMTTDHVYRRAMSSERAIAELTSFAGSQFDPKLVESFRRLVETDRIRLDRAAPERWLVKMDASQSRTYWGLGRVTAGNSTATVDQLFQQQLVASMVDGVFFVDTQSTILLWNRAFEKMSGLASASVFQKQWIPTMLDLRDASGAKIPDAECPIAKTIRTRSPGAGRYSLQGRSGNRLTVEMQFQPVTNVESVTYGAVVIARDISSEATLEAAIENLHAKATQDPLTKVSNRAEFDRVHDLLVSEHLASKTPCSLIICDLDFFKRVNDDFGHQAGDDALMIFASMLKRVRRQGDLVARYGGEEFVYLAANCDIAAATVIAEEIRQTLERTPQPMLAGKCCTASFGVTEIQPGDTSETMLRRADRALMMAKEAGRNRVMQLGSGLGSVAEAPVDRRKGGGLFGWFKGGEQPTEFRHRLISTVPLSIAVEKLRGFLSDHHAQVVKVDGDVVKLKVDGKASQPSRRKSDRPLPFAVELKFKELDASSGLLPGGVLFGTSIDVLMEPIRGRDRRREDVGGQVETLLSSLKAYFMAQEAKPEVTPALERAVTEPGRR